MRYRNNSARCPLCRSTAVTGDKIAGICEECGLRWIWQGEDFADGPDLPAVYHYTMGMFIQRIIQSFHIALAKAAVPRPERAAVWFSTDPRWEPSVGWPLEVAAERYGAFRIQVRPDVAQLTWSDHRLLHQHLAEYLETVERVAREDGADPSAWRLTYSRVWTGDWLAVERWRDGRWVTLWARHPKPREEGQAPPCAAHEAGPTVEGTAREGRP
ncbi:MAG TPA: hypothetical protein ENK62_06640 [Chromatiales bacterium]|nr:hypothetical protein [Chromatiales bacterium]